MEHTCIPAQLREAASAANDRRALEERLEDREAVSSAVLHCQNLSVVYVCTCMVVCAKCMFLNVHHNLRTVCAFQYKHFTYCCVFSEAHYSTVSLYVHVMFM